MAQIDFIRSKSRFAVEFTFPGKRRAHLLPTWLRSAAAIFMLLALGESAEAGPPIGPTSSTSVGISLSVAPRYGLKSNQAGVGAPGGDSIDFCMTTNGQPIDMPVHLVFGAAVEPAGAPMFKESAAPLHWCAIGGRTMDPIVRGEEVALLIVRPE